MNTSNRNHGFLARQFRSLTGCLCHPFIAWAMLLTLSHMIFMAGWSMGVLQEISSGNVRTLGGYHGNFLDSQDLMVEDLENTLAAIRECQ